MSQVEAPPLLDERTLREGLQTVLPTALVGAACEAAKHADDVLAEDHAPRPGVSEGASQAFLATFAAALGSSAVTSLASSLSEWLTRHHVAPRLPAWLCPAVDGRKVPLLVTLTDFANGRSRIVRDAVRDEVPVLISRHGKVIAAVIPLAPGAFEDAAYAQSAGVIRQARQERRRNLPRRHLTDEELEKVLSAGSADIAADFGVDTADWYTSNPSDTNSA